MPRGCLIPGIKQIVTLTTMMNTRRFQHGYPAGRSAEPWTQLTHRERLREWVAYNPRTMRPPPLSSDTNSMKILSWNVNGLQTVVQSGFSALELARRENFDVLCLQETHLEKLEGSKPVIVAGDLNCARQSMDIHNPPAKTESAGFTVEERESFERNFSSKGLIDTFRKQHPNAVAYTFWGENQRITNKGWRLDYFLASESVADKVHDSYIVPDMSFSDHSPIGLVLKL